MTRTGCATISPKPLVECLNVGKCDGKSLRVNEPTFEKGKFAESSDISSKVFRP